MDSTELRNQIISSLRDQGFRIRENSILPPQELSKDKIRDLHKTAVHHRQEVAKKSLRSKEKTLITYIASGDELVPEKIRPRLIEVESESENEFLFRYASLHWSIPVSSGYGRRLRFLVMDDSNSKLIGLIGLGDPVFNLGKRDEWIGWTKEAKNRRLRNTMDAFVLGAVPPYNYLLCGKLVAMLVASNEVRDAFRNKYEGSRSLIKQERHDGRLALITTLSALGKSSIYNRVRFNDRVLYHRVGFTKGTGEFHFSNGLYKAIWDFATDHCEPTAKQNRWGKGFRNRREVVRKALPLLGISADWLYHGISREVFVIPLAKNAREFLTGKDSHLDSYEQPVSDLFNYFSERWLIPRSRRDQTFKSWSNQEWLIWHDRK